MLSLALSRYSSLIIISHIMQYILSANNQLQFDIHGINFAILQHAASVIASFIECVYLSLKKNISLAKI
jgi:hypothetical protein